MIGERDESIKFYSETSLCLAFIYSVFNLVRVRKDSERRDTVFERPTMNLIEQLEKLPRWWALIDGKPKLVLDAYAVGSIIEQAKREAVEPVAVPADYKLVPIEYVEAAEDVLEKAPCDCSHKRRYENGDHYSGCHLFDLNIASIALSAAPEAPQPDHTKLIGELVTALEGVLDTVQLPESTSTPTAARIHTLITKAREAIK